MCTSVLYVNMCDMSDAYMWYKYVYVCIYMAYSVVFVHMCTYAIFVCIYVCDMSVVYAHVYDICICVHV